MSDKQETIADIVAEIRLRSDIPREHIRPDGYGGYETITINRNEYLISIADRIEAAHKREVGNGAKMREALEFISHINDDGYWNKSAAICNIVSRANAALAEPPRQCDVGTVEEQCVRYRRFCRQHAPCDNGNCPLRVTCDCQFTWAQMPYEEGGAK